MESAVQMTRPATAVMIARELGVTVNQVMQWNNRREQNGFPESLGRMQINVPTPRGTRTYRDARAWDLDAVVEWYDQYEPAKGGRPKPS
jgi:hypothetical protein